MSSALKSASSASWLGALRSGQQLQERLGARPGGGRVLARDEPAVGDDEARPILSLPAVPAQALQPVLDEERDDIGELDRLFFAVGEASHPLALHDRLTLEANVTERPGCVA